MNLDGIGKDVLRCRCNAVRHVGELECFVQIKAHDNLTVGHVVHVDLCAVV